MPDDNNRGRGRGFASMDREKQREIASKGGKAAHEKGTANEFNSQTGAAAGREGGKARSKNNNNLSDMSNEEGVM